MTALSLTGRTLSWAVMGLAVVAFTAFLTPLSQVEAAMSSSFEDAAEAGSQREEGVPAANPDLHEEVKESIEDRKAQLEAYRASPERIQEQRALPLEEKVYVRGERVDFQPYNQPPIIENGRTLVALRTVGDYLGAETDWDGDLNQVTIQHGDTTIEIIIGQTEVVVNGRAFDIDVPARITENQRTVVPLRFISEVMGVSVDYCEELQAIDLGLDPDAEPQLPWDEHALGPGAVVERFWSLQRQGRPQDAAELVTGEAAEGLEGMLAELDAALSEPEAAFLEAFHVEALSEARDNGTATVEVEITKPDIDELMDLVSESAMDRAAALAEEGLSEEEIQEHIEAEYDAFLLEAIEAADTVSYAEEVELEQVDGEWKVSAWRFEQMRDRWEGEELQN